MIGKKLWVIPDGHMNSTKNGNFVSHEAVCVLNLTDEDAFIEFEIYFEDKNPVTGYNAVCKSKRTNHIRLDKITDNNNNHIPFDTPYSLLVKSNVPVIVQHSRMDVTQKEMALMTTIAY